MATRHVLRKKPGYVELGAVPMEKWLGLRVYRRNKNEYIVQGKIRDVIIQRGYVHAVQIEHHRDLRGYIYTNYTMLYVKNAVGLTS